MALTREQFEGLTPTIETVPVHGTKEEVCIRAISARIREDFDNMVTDSGDDGIPDLPARLLCLCLCDEDGVLMYPETLTDDGKRIDIGKLAEAARGLSAVVSAPAVERLFFPCRDLNRMNKGAVEDAAKNSETDPADSSSTD